MYVLFVCMVILNSFKNKLIFYNSFSRPAKPFPETENDSANNWRQIMIFVRVMCKTFSLTLL